MLGVFQNAWRMLFPLKKTVVTFDDLAVTCHDADGNTQQVTWDNLTSIEIVTTDAGPFVEDVFWVLHSTTESCIVPQDAEGCQQFSERLGRLPNFDHDAEIRAICCASNARFVIWQRAPGQRQIRDYQP